MEKQHRIKVPVFTSKFLERTEKNDMFSGLNYSGMLSSIRNKINYYNRSPDKIKSIIPNTTKERVIENIVFSEHNLGEIPIFLITVNAYETNLNDVYVEYVAEKIQLEKDNKVGSEHNVFILYPEIIGGEPKTFKYRWIAFVYEEPTKDKGEIVNICKIVLNKILHIKTKNVKLSNILDEIKKMGTIDQLSIRSFSVQKDINDIDILFKEYVTSWKLKNERKTTWDNIPADDVAEIITNEDESDFTEREVKLRRGKIEYRLKEKINSAKSDIEDLAEEIFNEEIKISDEELHNSLYDENEIIKRLTPVISEYVSSYAK